MTAGRAHGIAGRWRWLVVVLVVAVLGALPALVARWPVSAPKVAAATLLARINGSSTRAYSGYAESTGGLALPVSSQFNSIADLFGGTTQMRVWWSSGSDWRVDTVVFSGESDVHQVGNQVWTFQLRDQSCDGDQADLAAHGPPASAF